MHLQTYYWWWESNAAAAGVSNDWVYPLCCCCSGVVEVVARDTTTAIIKRHATPRRPDNIFIFTFCSNPTCILCVLISAARAVLFRPIHFWRERRCYRRNAAIRYYRSHQGEVRCGTRGGQFGCIFIIFFIALLSYRGCRRSLFCFRERATLRSGATEMGCWGVISTSLRLFFPWERRKQRKSLINMILMIIFEIFSIINSCWSVAVSGSCTVAFTWTKLLKFWGYFISEHACVFLSSEFWSRTLVNGSVGHVRRYSTKDDHYNIPLLLVLWILRLPLCDFSVKCDKIYKFFLNLITVTYVYDLEYFVQLKTCFEFSFLYSNVNKHFFRLQRAFTHAATIPLECASITLRLGSPSYH